MPALVELHSRYASPTMTLGDHAHQLSVVRTLIERLARENALDVALLGEIAAIVTSAWSEPDAPAARVRWRGREAQTARFIDSPRNAVLALGGDETDGSLAIATGDDVVLTAGERAFLQMLAELVTTGLARITAQEDLREREARLELLDALAQESRSAADSDSLLRATLALLGKRLGAARCAYADVDANGDRCFVIRDWTAGCTSIVGEHRLSGLGPELAAAIRRGDLPVVVDDLARHPVDRSSDPFGTVPLASFVACTLLRHGTPRAIFMVQDAMPRAWSPSEVSLVEVVAERCWAAIEQRAAETKLRQNEAQLRLAGAAAKVGAWSFELAEKRVIWSEELYAIHEMPLGSPPSADGALVSCAPEFLLTAQKALGACIRDGTPIDTELQIVTATGRRKWIHTTGSAERDPATGKVVRLNGAMQDIDERRRLENELHQAQRMEAVGRLAGGVAHDFNNLLAAILGYTSLVLDGLPESDPIRADVLEVQRAGERASELTKQLLTFSRHRATQRRRLDARAVISDLEPMLRRLVGADVALVLDTAHEIGALLADRSQLEQVIVNLVVNARDASAPGGTIRVGVSETVTERSTTSSGVAHGHHIRLTVEDDGHGMDVETRAQMFEPFFTTKAGKGTGLGLATVYGIVDQSGGWLSVRSAPGAGTTFEVHFPRVEGPFDVEPASLCASTVSLRGAETILLADDTEQVRAVVGEILRRHGYEVLFACDGAEALRICEAHSGRIDLLLTDVMMPGLNGWELGARVAERRPSTCILHMSSFAPDTVEPRGSLERSDLIAKPFTAEALLRKLRHLLDRRGNAPTLAAVPRRVLYVDDEEALALLVKRALTRLGYTVTIFTDPRQALAAFEREPAAFDVLITDMRMPTMNGVELARAVRRRSPGLPSVLTSGVLSPMDIAAAEGVGFDALVTKSHTVEDLAARLDAAMRGAEKGPLPAP